MTDAVEFVPDPTLLEKYNIIKQSRSGWTGITTALTRLDKLEKDRDPYNEMETDRDDVLEYARTVRNCGDTIAYAIALAVHLSRHSRATTPQVRITRGFEAVGEGLGLRQRDEDDTRKVLKACMRALALPQPLAFDSWSDKQQLDDAWTEQLQTLIDAVNASPPASDVQGPAWDAWRARLIAAIQGAGDDSVDLNYLRCRAADALPGTILPVNLPALTINELSGAYIKGVSAAGAEPAGHVPLWFAYGMLALLGFDTGDLIATVTPAYSDHEKEQTTEFLRRLGQPTSPRKGIIVVRSKVESVTNGWMPLKTLPALSVTFDEYIARARVELRPYFASRLHGILLEVDPTDPAPEVSRRALHLAGSVPNVPIAPLLRAARPDIQGFATTTMARDLRTAAAQAFGVTSV